MHPEDEMVITMTQADWKRLYALLQTAALHETGEARERIQDLNRRLMKTAEVLTLKWLDRKLEEFP